MEQHNKRGFVQSLKVERTAEQDCSGVIIHYRCTVNGKETLLRRSSIVPLSMALASVIGEATKVNATKIEMRWIRSELSDAPHLLKEVVKGAVIGVVYDPPSASYYAALSKDGNGTGNHESIASVTIAKLSAALALLEEAVRIREAKAGCKI